MEGSAIAINDPQLSLQGFEAQGFEAQGFEAQGFEAQGSRLQGFTLQSFHNSAGLITDVTLHGTVFSGIDGNGQPISGAGFVGATVTGVLVGGGTVTYSIASFESSQHADVKRYRLAYNNGLAVVNPCGEKNGTPILAVPLTGRWDESVGTATGGDFIDDPDLFTFGCESAVLAKCVLLGYKPWKTVEECNGTDCHDLALREFHQACTRMMRADYCGNGRPHTTNGTMINLYDVHDIQLDESTTLPLEAEWSPNGATCVNHVRWTSGGYTVADAAQDEIDANCPSAQSPSALAACGGASSTFNKDVGYTTPLGQRALLREDSEAPPDP